jgi:hypothetical protein
MRKPCKPTPTDIAFACATVLQDRLGTSIHDDRIPTGLAMGSVHHYVVTGLRDHAWPLTRLSLRVAQMRSEAHEKAASERLWSEENP